METKPWYLSKTVIINGLAAAASLIAMVVAQSADLGIPSNYLGIIVVVQAWVNLFLRFLSSAQITLR